MYNQQDVCVCVSTEQNVDFDCVCDMCTVS